MFSHPALSLVSNAILYWNTSRISNIVNRLRENGEVIDDNELGFRAHFLQKSHLSHKDHYLSCC
ncbi:Tn3 family transposase [Salmonella enterica subsp. diarizonae]|nr:Tn3 family transposase [Salmonella enterica subsp. diarizonae]